MDEIDGESIMKVKRAYKYRFYPTPNQESLLRRTIGCCRFIYNRSLAIRSEAWGKHKEKLSCYDLQKKITTWKKDEETKWLSDVPNVALQQSVNNLEVAFKNFFSKRAKYPVFKKKTSGGSCRFTRATFRIKSEKVWLSKIKQPLNIIWSRPIPENCSPSQCTVKLSPSGEWHISFLCEVEINKLPTIDKHVGLDMGISALITTSNGEAVSNPRPYKIAKRKLAHAQRDFSRKVIGSRNQRKSKLKVARLHQRISNIRNDQLHKLSTRFVRENQSIAIEDLAVLNMLKNHCLAGAISDSGWYMFRTMLDYKCKWYGRELRIVDRYFPSSKTCSNCGHLSDKMALNIREWCCTKCGNHHDRDVNAAKNILAAGQAVNALGGSVRPKCLQASRQLSMNWEKSMPLGDGKVNKQLT